MARGHTAVSVSAAIIGVDGNDVGLDVANNDAARDVACLRVSVRWSCYTLSYDVADDDMLPRHNPNLSDKTVLVEAGAWHRAPLFFCSL